MNDTPTTHTPHVRWPDELPKLASDPRVTVVCDLDPGDGDDCGECPDDEVRPGAWRTTYRQMGHTWANAVCGSWCADLDLAHILSLPATTDITLHLPAKWTVPPDAVITSGHDASGCLWAVERVTDLLTGMVTVELTVGGRTAIHFVVDFPPDQAAMSEIAAAFTGEVEAAQ